MLSCRQICRPANCRVDLGCGNVGLRVEDFADEIVARIKGCWWPGIGGEGEARSIFTIVLAEYIHYTYGSIFDENMI